MSNYDDIINLKRPSSSHSNLSSTSRAAQFSPFAALTGYDNNIKEAKRITEEKRVISEDLQRILNDKINYLGKNLSEEVTICHFVKDIEKEGGQYINTTGKIKKIDSVYKSIKLADNTIIYMDDIVDITNDTLDNW